MDDENKKDEPKVQADHNSIAVGGIKIGGNVSGNITIGNTGYTSEEVSVLITQIKSTFQPKPFDGRCPYKGLDVFEEEDAELFFGREKLVDDLVNRVKESRTVFVTGPSGSGKSSLVRAGLIHALKQGAIKNSDRWLYATMKPGRDPIGELGRVASSLAGSTNAEDEIRAKAMEDATIFARWCEIALKEGRDKRVVLFIDQFEEVFTQISNEEERITFLNLLTHAATVENGRVIILFSMRSDFVSNCATYPQINALLNQQFIQIGAMQPEELVSAIAQPALRVGLRIDPDLIAQIINEMKGEPGALPLMQFALKDLFDSQQEKSGVPALTLNDYLQRGGIHKALERHADDSFSKLSRNEQELARSIFSGLIEIGRGTQDTRRTALFDELILADTKAEDVESIVQKLADARLVTTDEQAGKDTVTISHEKLIEAWPWLKKLVNENRDAIALQNEIASDAREWDEHNQDVSYLYRGARLANAREEYESQKIVLSELAQLFIETGGKAYADELKAANQRATQLRRQARNLTMALVFTLIAVVIATFFGVQSRQQARISLAHQMAAQAQTIYATRNSRQMQAVLLALHSIQLSPSSEASQVLLGNLAANPIAQAIPNELVVSVAFSPNGKYVASGIWNGSAQVWEAATGEIISNMSIESYSSWSDRFSAVSFSPDGKYVASVSLCEETDSNAECIKSTARVFDPLTGAEISHMTHGDEIRAVAFSPNGKYVATGSLDKTARVWDPITGKEIDRFTHEDTVNAVIFSPDSNYLTTTDYGDKTVHIWNIETGKEIASLPHAWEISSAAFSPDGKYVVTGSWFNTAVIWNVVTSKESRRITGDDAFTFSTVAFSSNGKYILSSGNNNVYVWDTLTGKKISIMTHENVINFVAFSPDSKYVVSASNDFTARVWDALTGKEISRMTHENVVNSVAFSPDSKYVISGSDDGTARVWEIKNNGPITYSLSDASNSVSNKYLFGNHRGHQWQEPALVLDAETANRVYKIFSKYQDTPMWYYMLSKNRKYLAIFPDPGDIAHVWDVESMAEVATFNLNGLVGSATFNPDEKYIVIGTYEDSTAHVWEIKTSKEVFQLTIPNENNNTYYGIESMDYSQDGKYIVTATSNLAKVWDATNGHEISSLIPPDYWESGITGVAFSPDGNYVLTKDLSTNVTIWEVKAGKEIAQINIESHFWGSDSSLVFSPDNNFFVLGTPIDKTARVYNLRKGEEISRMTHDDDVTDIALSPNGEYVVSTSRDGTARVWVAKTGKEIIRLPLDINSDYYVAFSSNSDRVLTGSQLGLTHAWQWQPKYLIGKVCATLPRDLTVVEWKQYIGDALSFQAVCPDFKIIAKDLLSNSKDPNRVKNALDKVKAELIKVDVFEDPTIEAFRIVSAAIVEQASTEINVQEVKIALDLIDQANQMQVQLSFNDPNTLNNLCWHGSLQGYEVQVFDFCERAVMLAPDDDYIRDSRGLARALTGDYKGAILDFQYYIDEEKKIGNEQSSDVKNRQQWIIDLKAGNNPFTSEVLDSLEGVVVANVDNYYIYTIPWPLVLYIVGGWLAYRAIFLRYNPGSESDNSTIIWKRFVIAGYQGGLLIILNIAGLYVSTLFISKNIGPSAGVFLSPLYVLLLLLPAGLWAGGAYSHFTRFEKGKSRRVILGSVAGIMSAFIPTLVLFLILILIAMSDDPNSLSMDVLSDTLLGLGIVGGIGGVLSAFGSLIYIFGLQKWALKSKTINTQQQSSR